MVSISRLTDIPTLHEVEGILKIVSKQLLYFTLF